MFIMKVREVRKQADREKDPAFQQSLLLIIHMNFNLDVYKRQRMMNAIGGISKIKENVDTLIVIPNDKLLEIVDRRTTMPDALKKADEVLQQAVQMCIRDRDTGIVCNVWIRMDRLPG